MCGLAAKHGLCDRDVTGLRPPLARRYNTLCAVGQ